MADDAFLHKIDEPSTLAGIKHLTPNTSKELQDIVVEKAGRLPEVTRFCTSLSKILIVLEHYIHMLFSFFYSLHFADQTLLVGYQNLLILRVCRVHECLCSTKYKMA